MTAGWADRALRYRELHAAGLSTAEIAAQMGVRPKSARERLRSYGLAPTRPSRRYRELYAEGLSVEQIAQRMGVRVRSVRAWLRENGLLTDKHPSITADEWARMRAMLDEGVPSTWVAEEYGRHASWLRERYRRETGHSCPSATEFRQVWPDIRRHERLRQFHDEFAPKKGI